MEEQFKEIDRITKKLVTEAGTHKPSAQFLETVMNAVSQEKVIQPYKPLISKTAWLFIGIGFFVMMLALYSVPSGQLSFLKEINFSANFRVKNPFSEVKITKTAVYGIVFLGLFLIEIPFLKRYLEK